MPDYPAEMLPEPAAASPVGCVGYAVGGLSFIPLVGVPFGLAAIIWGLVRQAWTLVVMGAGGILFSVVLYGSLYYFGMVQRGGVYDGMRLKLAVSLLDSTVKELEFYKLQHGRYPNDLSELHPEFPGNAKGIPDPTSMRRAGGKSPYFYYELDAAGGFYYLRSAGPDGVPFTGDDILPSLSAEERQHTGLRLER